MLQFRICKKQANSRISSKQKFDIIPYLFLLPGFVVLGIIVLYPLIYTIVISFFHYQINMPSMGITFVGLDNYLSIFQDRNLIASTSWTLLFTFIVVFSELILGMLFALILNSQLIGRMSRFIRGITLTPMMMSGVVCGFMWRLLFDPEYGPINHLMSAIGVGMVHWGSEVGPARLMVIITDIWIATPFCMLILLAGMQGVPQELYEVASIDGASNWQSFFRITLPLLKYPVMIILITRTMDALRIFDMIWVQTSGGPGISTSTIMLYIYLNAFRYFQIGRASAMSVVFLIVIFVISYLFMKLLRRDFSY